MLGFFLIFLKVSQCKIANNIISNIRFLDTDAFILNSQTTTIIIYCDVGIVKNDFYFLDNLVHDDYEKNVYK